MGLLDEAKAARAAAAPRNACHVLTRIPDELRPEFFEACDFVREHGNSDVTGQAIADALNAKGVEINASTVNRHIAGRCEACRGSA